MKQLGRNIFVSFLVSILIICVHTLLPATAKSTHLLTQTPAIELIQSGKQHYDAGQLKAAELALSEAAEIYRRSNRQLERIQTLSLLSLVYQDSGRSQLAKNAIDLALSLLEQISPSSERNRVYAQVLNRQGRWQLFNGKAKEALVLAQKAESLYAESPEQIGSKINQAQALNALGFFRRAEEVLDSIEQKLSSQKPSTIQVLALHSLGDLLRREGNLESSKKILLQSLASAQKLNLDNTIADILLSLGHNKRDSAEIFLNEDNLTEVKRDRVRALKYYQQAQKKAILPVTQIKSQLNQLDLLIASEQLSSAKNLLTPIFQNLKELIHSRESVYLYVNFAQNLLKLDSDLDAISILNTAIQQARDLQDTRAESYALGTLGTAYETKADWQQARQLTESALLIAQGFKAPELTYRWQWQLGRLLAQENIKSAIASYQEAVNDLQHLRGDLIAINPDIQFSFKQQVEPVYRQLIDLLLQSDPTSQDSQQNLKSVRDVFESLQLAELENFFHSACLEAKVDIERVIEEESPNTAVIYPIILEDRLEIIVRSAKTKQLKRYTRQVTAEQMVLALTKLRQYLPDVTRASQVKDISTQLYQWLIEPLESDLKTGKIDTLVFVVDGALRNIPPSVLYNASLQKYLIEQYAIAIAPSLKLVEPKNLKDIKLNALMGGVNRFRSIEGREFAPLANVERELENIASQVSRSEQLFNQNFTFENLRQQLELNSYSILHIATHGEFSSSLEQTFVLTWNQLLKVKDFTGLLRQVDRTSSEDIELLVLSACQTAKGDLQAGLGLAGIAVQSGARSTVATLWSVEDRLNTKVIKQFYQKLNQKTTKAKALQQAQLNLLKEEKRPYFWSPYVLIGNWL